MSPAVPEQGCSDLKGKKKAVEEDGSAEEAGDNEEVESEGEEKDEEVRAKPARGRPCKAILKDAAKQLKKL
ncbi:hypothetical protein PtB15_17B124 [Puccinia triticina]|nr:hypothetical protein PtB15_17B124 [Puccinia triticina]